MDCGFRDPSQLLPTQTMSAGAHDVGGFSDNVDDQLKTQDEPYSHWERSVHAVLGILIKKNKLSLDVHRRVIEALPKEQYEKQTYYEKWASGIAAASIAKGLFTKAELDKELGEVPVDTSVRFKMGDLVRVHNEAHAVKWRRPHLRTPGYVFGQVGRIQQDCCGLYSDPEAAAFEEAAPRQPLYRVRFFQEDLWEGYSGGEDDTLDVDMYQPWLSTASQLEMELQRHRSSGLHRGLSCGMVEHGHPAMDQTQEAGIAAHPSGSIHAHPLTDTGQPTAHEGRLDMHEQHAHEHHLHAHHAHGAATDHGDHVHELRGEVELRAADLEGDDASRRRLAEAVIRVLVRKGLVQPDEIRNALQVLDGRGAQRFGPRLVARAWLDAAFKARLLGDGNAAAAELGIEGSNYAPRADAPEGCKPKEKYGSVLTVVENTPDVHNLVVCTLCSCYPIAILGMSPSWYKSRAYRARSVRDPRGVLAEFGLHLSTGMAVRVHDSTADNRFLVLPERPAGTEGWDEERLANLVSRDSMIGTAKVVV